MGFLKISEGSIEFNSTGLFTSKQVDVPKKQAIKQAQNKALSK